MLLFLSFFVSVRSNVMFHGLELYFIPDSERGKYCIIYFHFRVSVCIRDSKGISELPRIQLILKGKFSYILGSSEIPL